MPHLTGKHTRLAMFLSVALHAAVFAFAVNYLHLFDSKPEVPKAEEKVMYLELVQPKFEKSLPEPAHLPRLPPASQAAPAVQALQNPPVATAATQERQLASLAAPAAPTAEEWAFAAKYTLKNSKGYRYNWGQQVRSMMGTAVEGADQGMVRFRLEIAPDGRLAKLETLWSTSPVAEQLARKAIANMPPLPPTPTGKPLVFEKTIAFTPYAADGPPVYKNDCLPDAPVFRNPFAWDGKSPRLQAVAQQVEKLSPEAYEECLKQLPPDSIDADVANNKAKMDRWGWSASKLGQ